jgi:hypothetical protein
MSDTVNIAFYELNNNNKSIMIEKDKDEKLLKQESEIQFLQFKFKLQHKQMSEISKKLAINETKKLEKDLLIMKDLADLRRVEIIEMKSKQVISNLKEEEINIEFKKTKDKFDLSLFKSKKLQERINLLEKNKLIYEKEKEKDKEKDKNENKIFPYKQKIIKLDKELLNKSNIIKSLESTKNQDLSIFLKKIESITEENEELRILNQNKELDIQAMHDQEIDEIIKKHEKDLNKALTTLTNLHTEVSSVSYSNMKNLELELQNKIETINILQKKMDNIFLENEELREINQLRELEIQQQHENELEEFVEKYDQKMKDIEKNNLLINNKLIEDNNNKSNNNSSNIESDRIKELHELNISLIDNLNNAITRQKQLESDIAVQFKYFSNKINETVENHSKEIDLINNNHKEKIQLYESNINISNHTKKEIEKLYKEQKILEIEIENKNKELLTSSATIDSLTTSTVSLRSCLVNSHKQAESLILEAKKGKDLEDEISKLKEELSLVVKEKEVVSNDLNQVLVTMARLHEEVAEDNEGKKSLENIELLSIKSKLLASEKEKDCMYIEMDGLLKDMKSLQIKEKSVVNESVTLNKKLAISENETIVKIIEIKDLTKVINTKKDIESDLRSYIVELQDNQKLSNDEIDILKHQELSSKAEMDNNIIEIEGLSKDLNFKEEIEIELRENIVKLNEEIARLSNSIIVVEDKLLEEKNNSFSLENEIITSNSLIDTLKRKLLFEENNNKSQINEIEGLVKEINSNKFSDSNLRKPYKNSTETGENMIDLLKKSTESLRNELSKAYEQSESLIILEATKRIDLDDEITKLNGKLIESIKEKESIKQEIMSLKSLLQEADKDYRTRVIKMGELNEDINKKVSIEAALRQSLVILEDKQKISRNDIDTLKSKLSTEEASNKSYVIEIERLMKNMNIKREDETNIEATLRISNETEKQLNCEINSLKTQLLSTETHNRNRINSLIKDMIIAKEVETDLHQDFVQLQLQLQDRENKSSVMINSLESKLKEKFDNFSSLEKEISLSKTIYIYEIDSLKLNLLSKEAEIKNKDNEIILLKKDINMKNDIEADLRDSPNNSNVNGYYDNIDVKSSEFLPRYRVLHDFVGKADTEELSIVQGEILKRCPAVIKSGEVAVDYDDWLIVRSLISSNGIYRAGYVPKHSIVELTDVVIKEMFSKAENLESKLLISNNKAIMANDDLNQVLITMARLHEQVAEDNEEKKSLELKIEGKTNELIKANNLIQNLEFKLIENNNTTKSEVNTSNSFISSWKNKLSSSKKDLTNIDKDIDIDIKVQLDNDYELRKSLENLENKEKKSIEEINSLKKQLSISHEQSESLIILEAKKRKDLEDEITKLNEESHFTIKNLQECLDCERTEKYLRTLSLLTEAEGGKEK